MKQKSIGSYDGSHDDHVIDSVWNSGIRAEKKKRRLMSPLTRSKWERLHGYQS